MLVFPTNSKDPEASRFIASLSWIALKLHATPIAASCATIMCPSMTTLPGEILTTTIPAFETPAGGRMVLVAKAKALTTVAELLGELLNSAKSTPNTI